MFFDFRLFRPVYVAMSILGLIVMIGTVGFMTVEGFDFFDSFYMTIITVSTVGFTEVHELSQAGRLFTSFLIITSFGTFAYAVTNITGYIVGGEYKTYFRDYKVNQEISKLTGHVIICGYGRNGRQAAKTISAFKKPFVLIESDQSLLEEFRSEGYLYIDGDATDEENLIKAGVERAKALITTLPSDSENVFVVLSARQLNSRMTIISRASIDGSDRKLRFAGADNVIMSDKIGGAHMGSLVMQPDLMEFIDYISVQGPGTTSLEEIAFSNIPDHFKYRTIRELESQYQTGARIIGFKNPEGEYMVNPSADLELIPGSKLFVLGTPEQIHALNNIFGVDIH